MRTASTRTRARARSRPRTELRLRLIADVLPLGRPACDAGLGVRQTHPPSAARCRCAARRLRRSNAVGSGPVDRDGDVRDRRVAVHVDRDRPVHTAARVCAPLSGDRRAHRWSVHVRRLDDDRRGDRRAGDACCIRLYACTTGSDCGSVSGPFMPSRSCSAGAASPTSRPPARSTERTGRARTRSTIAPQIRLSPSLRRCRPANGTRSLSTLSPSLESRAGREGERAEHRDRDHDHRRQGERRERRVAGQEHPGHRGHHRQPGDQHRAAGCRGRGFERCPLAATRSTFAVVPASE